MSETPGLAALTGGMGFIGRVVAARMVEKGWRLRLLTRAAPLHPQLAGTPFEAVPGELGDVRSLERLTAGVDVLVHCAGVTKSRDAAQFHSVNVTGAGVLGRVLAAKAPHARIVAMSSLAAREPRLSPYAASKAAGEDALRQMLSPTNELVILRPTAVYGPWDRDTFTVVRMVDSGVAPVLNGQDARISLVHVDDLAHAVVAACGRAVAPGAYEVADERDGYSWQEVIDALQAATGRTAVRVRVPRKMFLAIAACSAIASLSRPTPLSLGKAREILHPDWRSGVSRRLPSEIWRPRKSLSAGMAETVAWYRSAGWLGSRRRVHKS